MVLQELNKTLADLSLANRALEANLRTEVDKTKGGMETLRIENVII